MEDLTDVKTFYLFADAYLDSEWDSSSARSHELRRRGFPRVVQWFAHAVLFCPGLWWNAVWWDWAPHGLGPWDLAFGWSLTLAFGAMGGCALCLALGWRRGGFTCLALAGMGVLLFFALITVIRPNRGRDRWRRRR